MVRLLPERERGSAAQGLSKTGVTGWQWEFEQEDLGVFQLKSSLKEFQQFTCKSTSNGPMLGPPPPVLGPANVADSFKL
jgi:hypothetical protein